MKVVLQRVLNASVHVDNKEVGIIAAGLVVLLGIKEGDNLAIIEKVVQKIIQMRIFNDADGKMNRSLEDINGQLLIISQFTLYANSLKGNRPSFIEAARPELAIPLYEQFIQSAKNRIGDSQVATGIFGADMQVSLVNDGPVTIVMEY